MRVAALRRRWRGCWRSDLAAKRALVLSLSLENRKMCLQSDARAYLNIDSAKVFNSIQAAGLRRW